MNEKKEDVLKEVATAFAELDRNSLVWRVARELNRRRIDVSNLTEMNEKSIKEISELKKALKASQENSTETSGLLKQANEMIENVSRERSYWKDKTFVAKEETVRVGYVASEYLSKYVELLEKRNSPTAKNKGRNYVD